LEDLETSDWSRLSPAERIAHCHRKASEAQHEASITEGESRERHLRLAQAWLELSLHVADGKAQPMRRAR